MKSFLVRDKRPIVKWGMLKDESYYEGKVPEGYSLAICPSEGYIVVDVDVSDKKNGFDNIPEHLKKELDSTLNYPTKRLGRHYWFRYSGNEILANKTSNQGIDLRTHNGYVVWYSKGDIRNKLHKIKKTSKKMNGWLEDLFSYIHIINETK